MRAVLFDLDGTLLDIDLPGFLGRYFAALSRTAVAEVAGDGHALDEAMKAIRLSTDTMMVPHAGYTNREVFDEEFFRLTSIHLGEHWPAFERFYAEEFPALGDGYGPKVGARRAIETARELGLKVAVATNPIFPRPAIDHRLAWAGLDDHEFDVVTSYEWMYACKPHGAYFRQTAEAMGLTPHDCLMVGDDRMLDMPAADIGMKTFYVGEHADASSDYRGSLEDLAELLRRIVD